MADTGDVPSTARRAGLLARLLRFVATHQLPAGEPAAARSDPAVTPTVGLVACHLVTGGYGDQVIDRVEQALARRGHALGPPAAAGPGAPVVLVAHAGPRTRPALDAVAGDTADLAGRTVALVAYGPVPPPDARPLDALRSTLTAAGARVVDATVLPDTARLYRPAARSRPGTSLADPFERLALETVLDELLGADPHADPSADPHAPERASGGLDDPRPGRP